MADRLPPGIAGFELGRQADQRAQQGQMQLIGILSQLQARQEEQAQAREMRPLQLQQMQGQLAKTQADQQREQQFRVALSALGPNPSPGALAQIAAQFSSPDKVLDIGQRAADRQVTQEGQLAIGRERIAATQEAQAARAQEARERQQAGFDQQRSMAQLAAGLRQPPQPPAPSAVTIQDPNDPSKNIIIDARTRQVIGGAPKERADPSQGGVAGETAGKVSMADQAIVDIRETRGLLFDKDGKMKRGTVAAMNVPGTAGLPGHPEARQAYSKIYNAVEAKLRIETGAAATTREVDSIVKRFIPQPWDSDVTAKDKIDRLETFMSTTLGQIKGVRPDRLQSGAIPKPGQTAAPASPNIDALLEKYR